MTERDHFLIGEGKMTDLIAPIQRWTTSCIEPAEKGGFVAYGDYLTLNRQLEAANEMLREVAALKRYDPNSPRGRQRSTITVNVPNEVLDRIDAVLCTQAEEV